uniref:Uncharacterized protein n=1 Tax=Setaria digitata TaxID=48799 RepID=A0A915PPG1_9BILA
MKKEKPDDVHYANIGVAVTRVYAVPIEHISWNNGHSMSTTSSSSLNNGHFCDNNIKQTNPYCLSPPLTRCKYSDNHWKNHSYHQHHHHQRQQQQQQQLFTSPREWNGVIGRAHRVIVGVGGSRSKMTAISRSFQQRSFDDDNVPITDQQRQQEHHLFRQNYCFKIDLENDQQPLRIVPR